MVRNYVIDLRDLTSLNNFIIEANQFTEDINAIYGNHVVDAKSYIGLASISMHPVKVEIITNSQLITEKFYSICKPYLHKERNEREEV